MTNSTSTYKTLLNQLGRRADEESGFTLIELLVTMLVAALLAVVVIFALGGFTGQAQGSNAESMAQVVKTTAIARATYYDGGLFASAGGPITAANLQSDQAGIDLTATDPVYLASFTPVLSDGVTACTAANASTCVGFNLTVNAADGSFTDTYSIKYNGTAYTYPDSVKGVAGTW